MHSIWFITKYEPDKEGNFNMSCQAFLFCEMTLPPQQQTPTQNPSTPLKPQDPPLFASPHLYPQLQTNIYQTTLPLVTPITHPPTIRSESCVRA